MAINPEGWSAHNPRFDKYHMPEPNSGCELWIGGTIGHGKTEYGMFYMPNGNIPAHQFPFYPVPKGYDVHHKCKNTLCVNKDHLVVVTKKQHRELEGRSNDEIFNCGHLKSKENTYVHEPTGWKYCRTCNNQKSAARKQSRRMVKI